MNLPRVLACWVTAIAINAWSADPASTATVKSREAFAKPRSKTSQVTEDFFVVDAVRDLEIVFPGENFMQMLLANAASETFIPCKVIYQDQQWEDVGIRIKGNSSQSVSSLKKPFKLKFNEYLEDQRFFGVRKIALNNGFKDPSLIREAWAYAVLNQVTVSSRTTFVRLTINGQLWGLYTAVEVVDQSFLDCHFDDSDGNLFKCDGRQANLLFRGMDAAVYFRDYFLKTNEAAQDYSGLIRFLQVLNETPQGEFQEAITEVLDVESALVNLAFNVLTTNLDSYTGSGHNYYLYEDPKTGRFVFIPWDLNEVFGVFTMGMNDAQLVSLPLDFQADNPARPLIGRLLSVPDFRRRYEDIVFSMIKNHMNATQFDAVSRSLQAKIDAAVAECTRDGYALYSYDQFQRNLDQAIIEPRSYIFGLNPFVQTRVPVVLAALERAESPYLVIINEFMADNETGLTDEYDQYVDWIELANPSDAWVSLDGFFISDDAADPFKHELHGVDIPPQGFTLLWANSDPEEGAQHVSFKLDAEGESIILTAPQGAGAFVVDHVVFPIQAADISYGRVRDALDPWQWLLDPSPEAVNDSRTAVAPEFVEWVVPSPIPSVLTLQPVEIVIDSPTTVASCVLTIDWGTNEEDIAMQARGANAFDADFPPLAHDQSCTYFIECIDDNGLRARYPEKGEISVRVPPPETALAVTEIMASNDMTLADDAGEFDDWIELANLGDQSIDLSQFTVTDDPDWPDRCALPAVSLPPGYYIILWADGTPGQGSDHLNFKLDADGESVAIFKKAVAADGDDELISGISFRDLPSDCAWARRGWSWFLTDRPTPGEDNRDADF